MKIRPFLAITAAALAAASCARNTANPAGSAASKDSASDSVDSASALAAAVAGGVEAQASGINIGAIFIPKSPLDQLLHFIDPVKTALASAQCPTYAQPNGAACGGTGNQTMTLIYSGCSFGSATSTWLGGQHLTFGTPATCGTTTLPIVGNGDMLSRTFIGTIPGGNATTRTSGQSVVQLDTTTASGFSQSVSGGFFIQGTSTATVSSHVVQIQGIHLVETGHFDVSVSTPIAQAQWLSVLNPGPNRVIQTGTVLVQHNTAQYMGTAVFSNVAFNRTSCFPQSGTITTTFSGKRTGTETLVFNGNDNATITDGTTGASRKFALTHCF